MSKTTITEALQEIKTIMKRIQNNRTAITQYLYRGGSVRDPLEKDGGCVKFIAERRQAISDLETRLVGLRVGIQRVNLETMLVVGKKTHSVSEWLTWRKELSENQERHLQTVNTSLNAARVTVQRAGGKLDDEKSATAQDVIVHINERELMEEIEQLTNTLGELDGKLSLINATTMFEV